MTDEKLPSELNGKFLVQQWPREPSALSASERAELAFETFGAEGREPYRSIGRSGDRQFQAHRQGAAAAAEEDTGGAGLGVKPELMLDEGNLLPFHFLRVGDRIGRAVVKLQRQDGATGTGFLVASDILLTNHHVLPDAKTASSAVAVANYEVHPPDDPSGRSVVAPLDPNEMFVTNADLDFTFCGVRGLDFLGSVPLDRDQMRIHTNEIVNIIQHPRGRPKEVVVRDNWVVRADSVVLHYSCDTEPGSSGSPVFNNAWKPVALHHASVPTDSAEGRAVSGNEPARYINEGIRLSAIALWLETAEAVKQGLEQVGRLRALFGGLNAKVGFFGALGRRSLGKAAHELVADSYRKAIGTLDIGYWNLRTSGVDASERPEEVAQVLAEMGLDLWCLDDVEPAAAEALCRRLRVSHRLEFETIHGGAVGPPGPVFLYRKLAELHVERCPRSLYPDHPIAVKVRAGVGPDEAVELSVGVVSGVGDLAPLRDCLQRGDWLLMGADPSSLTPAVVAEASTLRTIVVAAGDRDEGVLLWAREPDSNVEQLFATPNLTARTAESSGFVTSADRALPPCLEKLKGGRPVAVRLAMRAASQASAKDVAPPAGAMIDQLERRLREAIEPILAGLLAELRAALSRGAPGGSS